MDFKYERNAEERGKGATVSILVNDKKVGEEHLDRTIPIQILLNEGLDVGMDKGLL